MKPNDSFTANTLADHPAGTPWRDPDDAPEWTAETFEAADLYEGGKLIRRGRPVGSGSKTAVKIRYDNAVLDAFRATGKGWQTRMNDVLRDYVRTHPLGDG
jgi:uncharacterized protein (DUF4415 family)